MLKKFFKLTTVLSLLIVAHLAYVQAFDRAVAVLRGSRKFVDAPFKPREAEGKKIVNRLAEQVFGREHWTRGDEVARYVMPEKGLVLFAMNLARITEKDGVKFDGKRIEVDPFAMVLGTPGGGAIRTMTSQKAIVDFNQPIGLSFKSPSNDPRAPKGKSEPERFTVKKARLERDVWIRDDRGTPEDPRDDLVVGPLTEVEYIDDGVAPVIRSKSEVVVVDRGLRVTGEELEIQFRPKPDATGKPSGIDGAQKLTLMRNVRTTFLDTAGGSDVLAGAGGPSRPVGEKTAAAPGESIPLDVQCQGPLEIELPRSPDIPEIGPPEPSKPTYVRFRGNVVVRRGKLDQLPDQIDCDTLHLTLLPGDPKPQVDEAEPQAEAVASADPSAEPKPGGRSSFGGLTLRRVQASGHAVWIQSPTQGVKIRCVELLHYKDPKLGKNTTVFNGGGPKKLWVEKREIAAVGPQAGKLQSVTHIWCSDATLIDDGDVNHGSLVANGPGLLESRPALGADDAPRDVPPARTAVWRDQLWMRDEPAEGDRPPDRLLVLKGAPRVEDRNQKASLEAADQIRVWLAGEEKPLRTAEGRDVVPAAFVAPASQADADARPAEALPSIRKLIAVKDVHLVDQTRDLRLRNHLQVDFEAGTVSASPPAPKANPNPVAPAPNAEDVPALTPVPEKTDAAAADAPAPPKMTAQAEYAVAAVVVGGRTGGAPGSEPAYELRDVELRGGVHLHQDPPAGKTTGTDAVGEVLILHNGAQGRMVFDLYHHDPHSAKGREIDPAKAPKARVRTEEMTVVADTIGVDQGLNHAWAYGAGWLKQLTDRNLFTDRPADEIADDRPADAKPRTRGGKALSDKVELTVSWKKMMTFEGVSEDPRQRPAAKIKFYGEARAQMEDSLLQGEESITIYTDKAIPLAEAGRLTGRTNAGSAPNADAEGATEPEPRADLSMIEVVGTEKRLATAISRKVHPEKAVLLNQQRMEALSLQYDRRSGVFMAPGPGTVYLYDREQGQGEGQAPSIFDGAVAAGSVVRPVAYRPGEEEPRVSQEKIAVSPDARRAGIAAGEKPLGKLMLTQIKFDQAMQGRFGSGRMDDVDEQRWAEFFGAVETARGPVLGVDPKQTFVFDRLPADAMFLTSEKLRVINEPPPTGAARTENGRTFLKAWDNAYARTKDLALQADVLTYDSLNELVLANGLEGRPVRIVQQAAAGQPGTPGRVAVVRYNVKTKALDVVGPEVWRLVDDKTGSRPTIINPADIAAGPVVKPRARPRKIITNPVERKGFNGR